MDFDVNAFFNTMLNGTGDEPHQALCTLFHAQLTQRQKTLFRDNALEQIKINPNNPAALFLLALVKIKGIGEKEAPLDAIPYLDQAVAAGYAEAKCARAKLYENGIGEAHSISKAEELYKEAIAGGSIRAISRLAKLNNYKSDNKTANLLYDQAIARNDPRAMFCKANLLEVSGCDAKELEEATQLLDRAILLNHAPSMNNRALIFEDPEKGEVNIPEAYRLYRQAVELNNFAAMNNLGVLLLKEPEPEKYYPEIIKLFDCGAAGNDAFATSNRGGMHEAGEGGPVNYIEALKAYQKASALGSEHAADDMRTLLAKAAAGTLSDSDAASKFYDYQITQGDVSAMFHRAKMYEKGVGGEQSYAKAIALYDLCIPAGKLEALIHRAYMHEKGYGGPVAIKKAIDLYDKGIVANHPRAMTLRAMLHASGALDGKVDHGAAIKLYNQALLLGDTVAMTKRADYYKTGSTGPKDPVKYRILHLIVNQKFPKKTQWLSNENEGMFELFCNNKETAINSDSISHIARAYEFLDSLPQGLAMVEYLNKKLCRAVELKIIPQFPIHQDFHLKVQKLKPQQIIDLVTLIKRYANHHYCPEGVADVKSLLNYEAFANSADPRALDTLKLLASQFTGAIYWVGMSYLKTNKPAGKLSESGEKIAIRYFLKAASASNVDKYTRELAQKKLQELRVKAGSAEELVLPTQKVVPAASSVNSTPIEEKKPQSWEQFSQQYAAPDTDAPKKEIRTPVAMATVPEAPVPVARPIQLTPTIYPPAIPTPAPPAIRDVTTLYAAYPRIPSTSLEYTAEPKQKSEKVLVPS